MKKKEVLLVSLIIFIQTIIYIICGSSKSYIHMDEAYSFGLSNYDSIEIQDNNDFYNTWHNQEYYKDYLAVQEKDIGNYKPVYINQKNDVHPPLYYLLLRFSMGFSVDNYTKWTGIILNIIIHVFITIFTYLILKKILSKEKHFKEKALILTLISSILLSTLSSVIYIRMYALSCLNILITTFLHMKLLDNKNPKLLILIGLSAVIGSLTHYYYLFYLVMLFIIFIIKYIKDHKMLIKYSVTMVISAITSLIIFPYSINHLFFGYRGEGSISKLSNTSMFLNDIHSYINKINYYVFNKLLVHLLIAIVIILIYKLFKKISLKTDYFKNEYLKVIIIPTIFYFLLTAITSPFVELRYIMPICNLIFIIVILYLYKLLTTIFKEKLVNIIMSIVLITLIIMPFIYKMKPEVMYQDKKEFVQKIETQYNVPTIYFLNLDDNRFLDDILLFSKLDNSYITSDKNYSDNINNILNNIDTKKGINVIINNYQNDEEILNNIIKYTSLNQYYHLEKLNNSNIYHIKTKI